VSDRWATGDGSGLSFPADPAAFRDGGSAFLGNAFRTPVTKIIRCEEVSGGSTGRKMLLDVEYGQPRPDRHTELFVKFSRDFDDPVRDRGRTQMDSEVTFASLSMTPDFPIVVPRVQFADYQRETGTGILISERIHFGANGIERQYHKCLDYEMTAPPTTTVRCSPLWPDWRAHTGPGGCPLASLTGFPSICGRPRSANLHR
jgi:hypothetical protein